MNDSPHGLGSGNESGEPYAPPWSGVLIVDGEVRYQASPSAGAAPGADTFVSLTNGQVKANTHRSPHGNHRQG